MHGRSVNGRLERKESEKPSSARKKRRRPLKKDNGPPGQGILRLEGRHYIAAQLAETRQILCMDVMVTL